MVHRRLLALRASAASAPCPRLRGSTVQSTAFRRQPLQRVSLPRKGAREVNDRVSIAGDFIGMVAQESPGEMGDYLVGTPTWPLVLLMETEMECD